VLNKTTGKYVKNPFAI
jgi:hypothetical protein